MANEKFKVKFGLAVGDTQATIDGSNGNISTLGDIDVKGGNITNSTGALDIATTGGNNLSFSPASPGQTVVNSAFDVAGNISGDLLNIDNITIDANTISTTDTNGNLLLDPNGSGQVHLVASSTQIGTGSANAQITTSGAHNMTLSTNNGSNSGTITIANGVAGNITIEPNTTGDIILGSDTVYVGDSGAAAAITTNGNAALTIANGSGGSNNIIIDPTSGTTLNDGHMILGQLNTAAILTTNGTGGLSIRTGSHPTSANIGLTDGLNGDVTIDTDGTGEIDLNAPVNITGLLSIGSTMTTTGANNLLLNTNNGTNSGQIQITQGLSGNISIEPSGTGFIQAGAANTSTTVTTSGTGNLILNTNFGTNAGSITLANGVNGAITLDPDGTGNVVLTFANGGNLTNDRNYVFGAIRNATTQSNGDIWVLDADSGGAGTLPLRGVSIDNSTDFATKNAGVVMRNYSNTGGFSPRVVFERSRYTGTPATPLTLSSGDTIGTIASTGYSSTLGWINDTLPFAPAVISTVTTEAWASNTNLGTQLSVLLTPTATTMTTAANLIAVIAANPQTFASRSDAFTWANGKTGSTQTMALDVSGNLTITGDLRVNGNDIKGSGGLTAITMTSANTQTTVTSDTFKVNNAAGTSYFQTEKDGANHIVASVNQVRATTGDEFAIVNFNTQRSTDGINYTPTLSSDVIGSFKFNGNANTSTSPGVPAGPGAQITAAATENWTASANGTRINFSVIKKTAITDVTVISAASDATTFKSDSFTLESSAGTDYLVMNGTSNTFYQPVGFPVYTVAAAGAITGAVGQQIAISNSSTSPSQSDDGMMVYWATNGTPQWRYIHNNGAL